MPSTRAVPDVGSVSPSSIRIVVVLPAPFGPSSPNTSPRRIFRSRWSTAVVVAVALGQLSVWMTTSSAPPATAPVGAARWRSSAPAELARTPRPGRRRRATITPMATNPSVREPFRRVAQVDVRRLAAGAGADGQGVVAGDGVARRLDDGGHLGRLVRLDAGDRLRVERDVPAGRRGAGQLDVGRARRCRCSPRSSGPASRCSAWPDDVEPLVGGLPASSFGRAGDLGRQLDLAGCSVGRRDADVDRVRALLGRGRRRRRHLAPCRWRRRRS